MADAWKKLRYRLEKRAVEMAVWMVQHLSRAQAWRLGWFLGACTWTFDRRSREVARANLKAAFGDQYNDAERTRIGRESMIGFARTMVDLFWTGGAKSQRWKDFTETYGEENAERARKHPKGAIFITHHLGNWEWLSFLIRDIGIDLRVIAQEFKNPYLGPLFDKARMASGNAVVGRTGSMVRLLKHISSGGAAAMLTDLTLRPDQPSVIIRCFGMQTCVASMHAEMQIRLGCILVPIEGLPQPDGRLRVEILTPLEPGTASTAQEVAQACWDLAENLIRQRPEMWLWSYKHWRYRPENPDREYPFYANTSKTFERRLAGEKRDRPAGRTPRKT